MVWGCLRKTLLLLLVPIGLLVIVAVVDRELLLKVPDVGFILWAITGGSIPPFLDTTRLGDRGTWLHDGDVVVASGVKAGTMWLHNIVCLLRTGGWDDFDNLFDFVGTMELIQYPHHSMEQREAALAEQRVQLAKLNITNQQHWTHYFPSPDFAALNPKENPKVSYICIVRNGKEVVRSGTAFFNSYTPEFRSMWGGYPPTFTKDSGLKLFTHDLPELYFGHVQGWWNVRNEPNVQVVHYRDLRKRPREMIRKIADTMGIPVSEETLDTIVHKSSLEYMTDPANIHK